MRLDKYLKVSRLIKRRTVANEACDSGRVQINGKIAKASTDVKIGDIIEEYIKIIGEKDEIKNSFFYREQKIINLESTIQELGITPLSFIVSNYVDN